jgi:UDP-N-acetylglucosamine 2-epimerase (non-hydrolysing)
MALKKRIICVVGTRPEAIKMAPVIQALKASNWANVIVLATAQHREMLDQVLTCFSIQPDFDLDIMQVNQSLPDLTARLIEKSAKLFNKIEPDAVLVHGDTTTAMACALAAFYTRCPIGHVEAGLRTWNIESPFPEEFNRTSIARIANWHFAPTQQAYDNLVREGIDKKKVLVTGNTVVDALLITSTQLEAQEEAQLQPQPEILVTCHRRENMGNPLIQICNALRRIAQTFPYYQLTYPVHPNPNFSHAVHSQLSDVSNISLVAPLDYEQFVSAMRRCRFLITDSGGIQEEAPALGKPVLVLREETERPEALRLGAIKLVGTDSDAIFNAAATLITNEFEYHSMVLGYSPYGDGQASRRIAENLRMNLFL